jgi:hypothetical protein
MRRLRKTGGKMAMPPPQWTCAVVAAFRDAATAAAPPGAVRLAACRRCSPGAAVRDAPAAAAESDPPAAEYRAEGDSRARVRATAALRGAAQLRRLRVASRLGSSLRCACLRVWRRPRGSQRRPAVACSAAREAARSREPRRQPMAVRRRATTPTCARRACVQAAPPLVRLRLYEGTRASPLLPAFLTRFLV